MVEGLAARGLAQRVIARRGQPLAARLRALPELGLQLREVSSSLLSVARACRGLALVHAHDGRSVHAAALARYLYGVPYVVTRRVAVALKRSVLTRLSYRRAACVVVLSKAIADEVQRLDPGLACRVVPDAHGALAAEPRYVQALRRRFADCFVVGHVGALDDATKGQRDLFAVARALADSHPQMRFVFVGDGVDRRAFHAETADLPNVEITGHVEDVGSFLGLFDAFAFPSRHEGMGSTLLDAMHAGVPVVATAVGGIVDLIRDGVNGMLVAPAAPEALGRAVVALHDDASLRATLVRGGRDTAREYSPERMVERYLEIYRPMLPPEFSTELQ